MIYFVYKLTHDSLNDCKLACRKAEEVYKGLKGQLELLSLMVNDESELKGIRDSLRVFSECLELLSSLEKRTVREEYSDPIDRMTVNCLMSQLKDSDPKFKKFFSHFELKKLKNESQKKQKPFRIEFLRSHYLKNICKFNANNPSAIKAEAGSPKKRRLSL